jgi:hypothetical protein
VLRTPFSLLQMCDDAFALNVLVREKRLKVQSPAMFYRLKDELVKYLYLHGHAVEVLEHVQERICWGCEGEGCNQCGDTGVYSRTRLYAFLFMVDGKPFKWHQVQKLCDYDVEFTDPTEKPYVMPPAKDKVQLSMRQEVWAFFRLWAGLRLRGCNVPKEVNVLALLPPRAQWPIIRLRAWWRGLARQLVRKFPVAVCRQCGHLYIRGSADDIEFCSNECWNAWVPF